MPADFFNSTVSRGALFRSRKNEFVVSNPPEDAKNPSDDRFSSIIRRSQASRLKRFSPDRLLAPLIKNKMEIRFYIPGTNQPAMTSGFGAVFVDVDMRRKTYMKLLNHDGCLIAKIEVPPRDRGLSFVGIILNGLDGKRGMASAIERVALELGTVSLKAFGAQTRCVDSNGDLVVLDDFIYGEPRTSEDHY